MEKKTNLSVHLFNCDNTFELGSVESLFTRVARSKLDFNISIDKHYFRLPQMSVMSDSTVPGLQMDLAVFVVHAHESRLSINEDDAGIGYAKIYRALKRATGDKVIIVIGGDDNYEDGGEENRVVLSRWSKKKIFSQFNEEYLDGRKSFIFSWNEQHRKIHEDALLHYFDPNKKGQKFEPKLIVDEVVDKVEEPFNNERTPVADSQSQESAGPTGIAKVTQSRPQEEGKEDPEGQKGSTGGTNVMAAGGNETVPRTVALYTRRWWHSLTEHCTIL